MRIRTMLFAAVVTLLVAAAVILRGSVTETPSPAEPVTAVTRAHAPSPIPALVELDTASEAARDKLQVDAYRSLVDALRADPLGMTAELEAFLADADPREVSTQTALGALVAVGTPEMQQALVRLVDKRAADDAFARGAIPVMAFLKQPTVATEDAIRAYTRDGHSEAMQSTSHLALGIMATQLATGETGRSTAIVADYATRLASAETAADRKRWLLVLGNARTPDAASAIEAHLTDADPEIRRSAVEAMRLAPAVDAEARLTAALADADATVRGSAVWSLSHRQGSPAMVDAMLARLSVERDETVVSTLLTTLWTRRDDRVVAAVRQLAQTGASPAIRQHAQHLLENGAPS